VARQPNVTPGPGGTPGAARTPSLRGRSGIPPVPVGGRSDRGRAAGARGSNGVLSEPASPRCGVPAAAAPAGLLGLADSLEELLPPGEDGGPAASTDNVRVFVRVRPLNAREQEGGGAAARACVSCPPGGRVVVLCEGGRLDPLSATFDRVFGPEEGQEEVFAAVGAQMVDNCMAGGHARGAGAGSSGSTGQRCARRRGRLPGTSKAVSARLCASTPLQASTPASLSTARRAPAKRTPSRGRRRGARRAAWTPAAASRCASSPSSSTASRRRRGSTCATP
jgi:hypothetical protein